MKNIRLIFLQITLKTYSVIRRLFCDHMFVKNEDYSSVYECGNCLMIIALIDRKKKPNE